MRLIEDDGMRDPRLHAPTKHLLIEVVECQHRDSPLHAVVLRRVNSQYAGSRRGQQTANGSRRFKDAVVIQLVEPRQDVLRRGIRLRVLFQQREEGPELGNLTRSFGRLAPAEPRVSLPDGRANLLKLHIAKVGKHRGEDVSQHARVVDVHMRRLLLDVHRVEAELLMIEELHITQPFRQPLVNVGVIGKHNRRDGLRHKLLTDVEQRLGFAHPRQSHHHQMRVRFAGHLPLHVCIAEGIGPKNDPGRLCRWGRLRLGKIGVRHFGILELAVLRQDCIQPRLGQFRNSEVPDP